MKALIPTDIQRKAAPSEELDDEDESPSEDDNADEDSPPPKKKAKQTPSKKPRAKSSQLSTVRVSSPLESSDDDVPLRPGPSDNDIKFSIREFLTGKDLATLTKGMVKEALRHKYGDELVKNKKEIIAKGIEEGMEV